MKGEADERATGENDVLSAKEEEKEGTRPDIKRENVRGFGLNGRGMEWWWRRLWLFIPPILALTISN